MAWRLFSCLKTPTRIRALISAILTRFLFILHSFFAIFLVVQNKNDSSLWWPVLFLFLLLIESGYTLFVRHGEDYKYFWPSCFLYIMSVLPSVWIMEIDLYHERTSLRSNGHVTSNNITTSHSNQNFLNNLSKQTIAENVGALGLTIGIITGRWLLPRGQITRDQLSALLICYIGIAADILEIFELFEEEKLMYNKSITMATLFVFSWCLLSFCLVTTATIKAEKKILKNKVRPVENGLPPGDPKLKEEYIKKVEEKRRKDVQEIAGNRKGERQRNVQDSKEQLGLNATKVAFTESSKRRVPIHGDIYGILTGIFMMDGPFFVFRLYCTVQFGVDNEMHIFYTCKNAISLILLVYRLCILTCKGNNDNDELYNEIDEDKLRNVQIAVVGTTNINDLKNTKNVETFN